MTGQKTQNMAFTVTFTSQTSLPTFNLNSTSTTPVAPTSFNFQTLPNDNTRVVTQIDRITKRNLPDGTIELTYLQPAPATWEINKIEIFGVTYQKSETSDNLEAGEFKVIDSNKIVFSPNSSNPPPSNFPSVRTTFIILNIKSDRIKTSLPKLFTDFPVTGSINIKRSFAEHPSASLEIVARDNSFKTVLDFFNNNDNKIIFFGIGFRCVSLSYSIRKLANSEVYEYPFSIQLEGFWRQLGEDSVKIRPSNNPVRSGFTKEEEPFSDRACKLTSADINEQEAGGKTPQSTLDQNKFRLYLSAVAQRANVVYKGVSIFKDYDNNTSSEEKVTFSELFEERASWKGAYPFYSDATAVRSKNWEGGESGGNFPSCQILSTDATKPAEIAIDINVDKLDLEPIEFSWGYNKDDDDEGEETLSSLGSRLRYEPPQEYTIVDPPDGSAKLPPIGVKSLKTLSLNYDASGSYSQETETTYIGSNKLRETISIYGFAYNAIDIVSGDELNGNPATYWKEVDRRTVDYLYDPITGYLTGANVSGYQLRRFKVESDEALETIELEAAATDDPPDADALAELNAYKFKQSPTTGFNRKLLAQIRDYFGATNGRLAKAKDKYIFFERCGSNGQIVLDYKANPNYVEPFFEAINVDYFYNFDSIPAPEGETVIDKNDNEIKLPAYYTGEERFNRSEIKVVQTLNTPNNPPSARLLPNSRTEVNKDYYLQKNLSYTARDPGFLNYKADANSQLVEGIPTEAARIPRYYTEDETLAERDRSVTPNDYKTKYVIHTTNYDTNYPIVSSRNFPELTSQEEAEKVIRTEFEILSFLGQKQITFLTNFSPNAKEGSNITVSLGKFNFPGKIISVEHLINVIGKAKNNKLFSGSTKIVMGFLEALPTSVYTYKDDLDESEDNRGEGLETFDIYYKGKEIQGDTRYISTIQEIFNRGNL
ncbi:MAG: hypothetical protein QNJ54_33760 [Prochloraceae cyanobacterium]|nr:hypothetical protein [Prochloraceae cyanobacterium]